jgi:hypothetical protein
MPSRTQSRSVKIRRRMEAAEGIEIVEAIRLASQAFLLTPLAEYDRDEPGGL